MSLAALTGRDPGKDWRAWGEWWDDFGAERATAAPQPTQKPLSASRLLTKSLPSLHKQPVNLSVGLSELIAPQMVVGGGAGTRRTMLRGLRRPHLMR